MTTKYLRPFSSVQTVYKCRLAFKNYHIVTHIDKLSKTSTGSSEVICVDPATAHISAPRTYFMTVCSTCVTFQHNVFCLLFVMAQI